MDLYFAPLSCSLATRIALYEAGIDAGFHQVVLSTKLLTDGNDYRSINPKGQVPALRLGDGTILTEGAAVLQYVADQAPASGLAPAAGSAERYRLQSWLNYIAGELHKQIFYVLFNPAYPSEAKAFAKTSVAPAKFAYVADHLKNDSYLIGDRFTVADAYLIVVLGWTQPAGIDLAQWPELVIYRDRIMARSAVARAFSEELALRG